MFFIVSKIVELVAAPFNLALISAMLGAALLFTRRARLGRALVALGVGFIALISFGPFGHLLVAPLEARFPPPPQDMAAPDGIIVLGGSVDEHLSGALGRPVLSEAVERLIAPIALRRRFPHARLVFTGGSASLRRPKFTEADTVALLWRDIGLDTGDVIYEDRSRNTFENAVFTRDLVQPKAGERWLLVTSAIHMPRSVGIFRRAGFDVVPFPVDFRTTGEIARWRVLQSPLRAFQLFQAGLHEWVGMLAYRLTGKTDALFPGPDDATR
jgi:uncharacterized SAM-binding protein YcdF (DUF218 family)